MDRRDIARLLPGVFQRTLGPRPNVLDALLGVMEQIQAPSEATLARLDTYFDPDRAGDRFIPFLARWADMDILLSDDGQFPAGMARLRDLILAAVFLAKWRGTRYGLVRFLEIATGARGFQMHDAPDQPFHVIITCPEAADAYRALIEQIIELEKPAYVTYELTIQAPLDHQAAEPEGGETE